MVPPAVVVAATRSDSILRCSKGEWFRLPQSSRLRRIVRLPQSRCVQAGTGCHEGGIILSKKPPEWRLSPPYQRSASESNLLCGKLEWFRLPQSSRLRRIACLQQSRWVQAGTGCHEGGIILSKSRRSGTCPGRNNDGLAEILLYLPLQSMSYGQFIQESQEQ